MTRLVVIDGSSATFVRVSDAGATALKELGAEVLRGDVENAGNLREGAGKAPAGLPQLVLLDLKLPKVDGHEVLRQIRENERTKYLPVVILTSSAEEKDLLAGYGNGANSYIVKPVDFDRLATIIRAYQLYKKYIQVNILPETTAHSPISIMP